MRSFIRACFLPCLLVSGCGRSVPAPATTAPPPASQIDQAALLRGALPAGPEIDLVQSRCQVCHTLEYVTQQRLSAAQWDKTLTKMQKWGSPISDDEQKQLAPYLAMAWKMDMAERISPRVPTPAGALPAARTGGR